MEIFRFTKDLDLIVFLEDKNLEKLFGALKSRLMELQFLL